MNLPRSILDVLRGATGAAMAMSVGCSSMREAPPPPPPASPVVLTPIRSAPIVMQPLPPLPEGADVPADLVPLPAVEPAPTPGPPQARDEAPPPEAVSSRVLPPNQTTWPPEPDLGPGVGPIGDFGPGRDLAATCGRG